MQAPPVATIDNESDLKQAHSLVIVALMRAWDAEIVRTTAVSNRHGHRVSVP